MADWSMFEPRVLAQQGFGGYESNSLPHFRAALAGAPVEVQSKLHDPEGDTLPDGPVCSRPR
ncbi:MAG: hypothetical protein ABIQ53_07295 [Terracoccus sp.]